MPPRKGPISENEISVSIHQRVIYSWVILAPGKRIRLHFARQIANAVNYTHSGALMEPLLDGKKRMGQTELPATFQSVILLKWFYNT